MTAIAPDATLDVLSQLHTRLDANFRELHEKRTSLAGEPPVYALEHGLSESQLDALKASVRFAVAHGFRAQYWRHTWLPFIVYAAESGYDYEGNEYWPSFEQLTPGWELYGDRDRIRMWFRKFSQDYGGAVPKGAFAQSFSIIAWPITHAVLPVHLQRHLAQLLYEFRMGLTTDLLQHPEELGNELSARALGYTERFRVACQNTSLLGQVASALLLGEGEESPYLLRSTLRRLVDGLEQERQAKFWLQGARNAASRVRGRGFQGGGPRSGAGALPQRLPNATDPRLVLRLGEHGWLVYAELPDLSSLNRRLPHVYDELRTKRARIEGADRAVLARGRLATPGQQVRLSRWPDPREPFVQLEGSEPSVNALLRDQVEITREHMWLFKRRTNGFAVELKSKLIRPGCTYYVVHDGTWAVPEVKWARPVKLDVIAAQAVRLVVPERLDDSDLRALVAVGLSATTDVVIRPVGIAASAWDGEGAVEWLAGEPGLAGIHVQQIPYGCTLTLDGQRYTMAWPEGESELFLSLEDLRVGEHELRVTLTGTQQQTLSEGSLCVTIRDPQARSNAAESGEGIRLLTSPARPTVSEIWEPAALSISGPQGLTAELTVSLHAEARRELTNVRLPITLPLLDSEWAGIGGKIRSDDRFARNFDRAESLELTVERAGVGYASLTADRGFQPLRWQLLKEREANRAHLIDRTDSTSTRVELYRFDRPLIAEPWDVDTDVIAPASGGLLRAIGGEGIDAASTVLLPTQPSELLGMRVVPEVQAGGRTPGELARLIAAYQLWAQADLPGDVFAQHQRDVVLEAITRALVSLICGGRWATVERSLARANDPLDVLESLEQAVGETDDQKKLARSIGKKLYAWLEPASLLTGFAEVIERTLRASGSSAHDSAPRFLLTLAGRPGQVTQWRPTDRSLLLQQALASPVLLRAARYAVVGTRLLNEAEEARKGF